MRKIDKYRKGQIVYAYQSTGKFVNRPHFANPLIITKIVGEVIHCGKYRFHLSKWRLKNGQ